MTTYPSFNASTTGTEVASAFSSQIQGKTVLIVGVSPNSLGQHLALALASHSPSLLLLASRSPSKINSVISTLPAKTNVPIKAVAINLSSLTSVREAAGKIKELTTKLDIIINNAAINVPDRQLTEDGIEMHFATNHLGLFLLANLLLPEIRAAAGEGRRGGTRVINLTSAGHRLSPVRFGDINFNKLGHEIPEEERPPEGISVKVYDPEKRFSTFVAYAQSKTANILFSVALTRRLKKEGVVSISVHPGSIWTGLARNLDDEGQELIKGTSKVWKTGDQGAATALVAAFDPGLDEGREVYMLDCQPGKAAPFAVDVGIAERLWGLSEELVGEKFEV